jgi:hypothetical protein
MDAVGRLSLPTEFLVGTARVFNVQAIDVDNVEGVQSYPV